MSRQRQLRWLITFILMPVALAQTHNHHGLSQQVTALSGKDHPELISDQEAITIFFITIMAPSTAGAPEKNRFSAMTGRMQLSEADSSLLWKAAQTFHSQFQPYRTEADTLAKTVGDTKRLDTERMDAQQRRIGVVANIDVLAQSTYAEAATHLSPVGAAKLHEHIEYVKTKMKIVPSPKM